MSYSKARSVAARLGICSRTLFRWADQGKIKRHKISARTVLFDDAEIADFIKSTFVALEGLSPNFNAAAGSKSGQEVAKQKTRLS